MICDMLPKVISENRDYVVVYKPSGMHTAPLVAGESGTLLAWVLERCPEVAALPGIKPMETGLIHRLDQETSGLVLIARTEQAFRFFLDQSANGNFIKYYRAECVRYASPPPGLSHWLVPESFTWDDWVNFLEFGDVTVISESAPIILKSMFRAYGPGRRQVSAVPCEDQNKYRKKKLSPIYATQLIHMKKSEARYRLSLKLNRGFRHQVRVHLASIGLPIIGDALYGGLHEKNESQRLGLEAYRLIFPNPMTGTIENVAYS